MCEVAPRPASAIRPGSPGRLLTARPALACANCRPALGWARGLCLCRRLTSPRGPRGLVTPDTDRFPEAGARLRRPSPAYRHVELCML